MNSEDSNIVFIEPIEEVFISIALTCPMEHGFNGITGFRYDAIKDYISWHYNENMELKEIFKEYLPIFLHIGSYFANEIRSNHK